MPNTNKSSCQHRYIYTPKPERSSLAWALLALTIIALCGIGLVLTHAIAVWVTNGSLL